MKYNNYSAEDFITDDYFREWVEHPDEENQKFWDDWIRQHPERLEAINEARSILEHLNFKVAQPDQADYHEVKENIQKGIEEAFLPFPVSSPLYKKKEWQKGAFRIAAALLMGMTLLGLAYFYLIQDKKTTYTTHLGETKHIVLPDSSTVILNANSTLSLSSDWLNNREVWLKGEAYFSVKKLNELALQEDGPAHPVKFTVHTEHLEVVVLGTRFNVNERRGSTKVVLNSGRVQLKNTTNKEIMNMSPGDLVDFSKAEKKFQKKVVDPELLAVWKAGHFAFDGTPIRLVAKMLEDIYGYQVTIDDEKLAGRKFTADIPSHDIGILLELIAESLDVSAEKENNVIVFKNE